MAVESAKKFLAALKADKALAEKYAAVAGATEDEKIASLIAAAKADGYDFTAQELKEAAIDGAELSEDELANVAGGKSVCVITGSDDRGLRCIVGGSGCFAVGVC